MLLQHSHRGGAIERPNNSDSIEAFVETLRLDLSLKNQKRLRLDMVQRIACRLNSLSPGCEKCLGHRTAIDSLVENLESYETWQLSDWKSYYRSLDAIIKHLKGVHHLVEEGDQMGWGAAIGVAIGVVVGAAINNIGLCVGVGIALGAGVFGMMYDAIAHKQDRVI